MHKTFPKHTIHDLLQEFFGYKQFRPLQEDIINNILEKKMV